MGLFNNEDENIKSKIDKLLGISLRIKLLKKRKKITISNKNNKIEALLVELGT